MPSLVVALPQEQPPARMAASLEQALAFSIGPSMSAQGRRVTSTS